MTESKVKNPFYRLPRIGQWLIALLMMGILIWLLVFWSALGTRNPLWYLSIFLLMPPFQFLITPFARLTGMYTYLSPILLVYFANDQKYDLHNGTPFDYLMLLRGSKPGSELRRRLLAYYIEGLINITEKVEQGTLPETVIIHGSSYFFSESTANRLGFTVKKTGWAERINIIANYLDLIWMYSLSKGKLTFPDLKQIKTVETSGGQLLKKKPFLQSLYQRLQPAISSNSHPA
jgi:hypothetical protein